MSKIAGATIIDGCHWVPFGNHLVQEEKYDYNTGKFIATGRLRRAGYPWPVWDMNTRLLFADPNCEGVRYKVLGEVLTPHPIKKLLVRIRRACINR